MIVSATLLKDLQKRVTLLEEDLRRRCDADPQVNAPLQAQYEAARGSKRTAETFNAWRDEQVTQVAVAWVLACVFVRFLEDNQLLDIPFLAGPDAARMNRARDEEELFFKQHPTASERDYLLHVFGAVGQLPGMREFFDRRHNPLWRAGPTGDALAALLDFWRKTNPDTGTLVHDFTDQDWNTRFLGDLYQDLSEFARKRYALLQTPAFVEEFILDRTLTPAIDTFGYREVRMLDLTCGSGHFLLGGFDRLFRLWQEHEPGENPRVLAQRALDQVCGVDLNPYAISIARFRLLLAALRACGVTRLRDAPNFQIQLAVGDSLLHGARFSPAAERPALQQTFGGDELFRDELHHFYETEDREALHRILGRQYHVVVGNPPYITVKDKALNQLYRDRFDSCHGKYSLAAPFMERFFDFAIRGEPAMKWDPFAGQRSQTETQARQIRNPKSEIRNPVPAGFVGMITANSFMKREFGKKLIEECIPRWDLTHVIDTSGAYIPGHGTPTVVLFGKHQQPVAATIRTVMGIKGEPATPEDAARGLVWTAILRQVDQPGSESDFVSVADSPRESFHRHPWSIGGGGAAELKEEVDQAAETTLQRLADSIGITSFTLEDDIFLSEQQVLIRHGLRSCHYRDLVVGDGVRDWTTPENLCVVFPYDANFRPVQNDFQHPVLRWLWLARTNLSNNKLFGGKTKVLSGLNWFELGRLTADKLKVPRSIVFAFVATHNHFVLERRGKVFNRSSPVIKLPEDASDNDHFCLLGLLNSATACFWMKQVFHNKGSTVDQHGARQRTMPFEDFFEHDGTKLLQFPVPAEKPSALGRELDRLAQELGRCSPARVLECGSPLPLSSPIQPTTAGACTPSSQSAGGPAQSKTLREVLADARSRWTATREWMIALQEELDWECYRIYGLLPDASLSFPVCASAPLRLGVEPSGPELTQRREDATTQQTGGRDSTNESALPPLRLGERAFEIVMARKMAKGELQTAWFERHGSTPITDLPAHWPAGYRALVERRIALIGRDRNIALIEQPEYKRRWNTEPWEDQQERALRQWLLNRLEGYFFEGERMLGSAGVSPAVGGVPAANPAARSTSQSPGQRPEAPEAAALPELDALRASWPAGQKPALVSINQLAEVVQADASFLEVAEVHVGAAGFSVPKLVRELVESESVPFLPFQRYKESGLRKRQDWERTWNLQRKEDAIDARVRTLQLAASPQSSACPSPLCASASLRLGVEPRAPDVTQRRGDAKTQGVVPGEGSWLSPEEAKELKEREVGNILVPPKYVSADFKSSTFWRLRGKLDVSKERWISYPGAEREGDPSPVIAWAGWNHLQQAKALAEYYLTAKDTWGWSPERLTLLLAGLADLLPWLKQWHNDPNPEYGMGLGDYFAGFLDEETRKQGATVKALNETRLGGLRE
jgi:hypothetical protein